MMMLGRITTFILALLAYCVKARRHGCEALVSERKDCGYTGIRPLECKFKGCCWEPSERAPWCFHTIDSCQYNVYKISTQLILLKKSCSTGNESLDAGYENLIVKIRYLEQDVVNIKIEPVDEDLPDHCLNLYYPEPKAVNEKNSTVRADMNEYPFRLKLTRKSDDSVLFDMPREDSLRFQKYFALIRTRLLQDGTVHGLGYRAGPLTLASGRYAIFSRDAMTLPSNGNLYSAHPMYIVNSTVGMMHGVFMKNSFPQEVEFDKKKLTWRLLGGKLDFYVFPGPRLKDVVRQYLSVIGKPALFEPKYLGLQQSRYGYKTLNDVIRMVKQYERNRIPLDVVCHLYGWNDFLVDEKKYPKRETVKFIADLHKKGISVIPIVDPAIKTDYNLKSLRSGIEKDIFMKTLNSDAYVGKVWPGECHFIDFWHPNATEWLKEMLFEYNKTVNFDGLWLDMNEPSNFEPGFVFRPSDGYYSLNYPKYDINNGDNKLPLYHQTVPMDIFHWNGLLMYETHNVYGMQEAFLVSDLLASLFLKNKFQHNRYKPFQLTRSVFPGSGQVTATWLGDNFSSFDQLIESIRGILKYNIFGGIAMVGPDLCGFGGDAGEELCARWMALGAFFPFSRNHNSISARNQEPYRWNMVSRVTRKYFALKYGLLLFWTTNLYLNHRHGSLMMHPFSFDDRHAHQFYIGVRRELMVCAVVEKGLLYVDCMFDNSTWYALEGDRIIYGDSLQKRIKAPLDYLPVFVRAGTILFMLTKPSLTVKETIKASNITLTAYLDNSKKQAFGMVWNVDMKVLVWVWESSINNPKTTKVTILCIQNKSSKQIDSITTKQGKDNVQLLLNFVPCSNKHPDKVQWTAKTQIN